MQCTVIWRESAANNEKLKAATSNAYLLLGYHLTPLRLKLRKSFFRTSLNPEETPEYTWTAMQKERTIHLLKWMGSQESLAISHMDNWLTWKPLERLQIGINRTKGNLRK